MPEDDPFKLGAFDPMIPMIGDETGSECDGADGYFAGLVPAPESSTSDYLGREHVPDPVINPSMLQWQSQNLPTWATETELSLSAQQNIYSLNRT
jgi:hypothetical protein